MRQVSCFYSAEEEEVEAQEEDDKKATEQRQRQRLGQGNPREVVAMMSVQSQDARGETRARPTVRASCTASIAALQATGHMNAPISVGNSNPSCT